MNEIFREVEESKLLEDVSQYYQGEFSSDENQVFTNFEIINTWKIGFSNGNLLKILSKEQKGTLKRLGLINARNQEVLINCVTLPLKNIEGKLIGFLGHNDKTQQDILTTEETGFANLEALGVYNEQILLPTKFDATFELIEKKFKNVFPIFGKFQDAQLQILIENQVKQVVVEKSFLEEDKLKILQSGILIIELQETFSELIQGNETKKQIQEVIYQSKVRKPIVAETRKIYYQKDKLILENGDLKYKVSGLKEKATISLRVSITIQKDEVTFVDTVDLMANKSRKSFGIAAEESLGIEPKVIEQDIVKILEFIQQEQEKRENIDSVSLEPLTDEEKELGLKFLKNPNLFEEIIEDMTSLCYAGEETNKQIAYLVATSRLQDNPLNMLVVSAPAAGKSSLIDTVKKLIPPSEIVSLTSLTEQSLNYLEPEGLLHKLLILGEAVHGEAVEHQLREIISSKELSRLVTTRDSKTGQQVSKIVRSPAVVALMMSTTHKNHNPENLSRYFHLQSDESPEQTERIHQVQNSLLTINSLKNKKELVPQIIKKHHAAQRLLRKVLVVTPESVYWELPTNKLKTRRDNKSLNDLMATICFLRQYQKVWKSYDGISYIECDAEDKELAWNLFKEGILKSTYSEFPKSMVDLYEVIRAYCKEKSNTLLQKITQVSFFAGELRSRVKFMGFDSVQKYLKKLVNLEFLTAKGSRMKGKRVEYQLCEDKSIEGLSNVGN